MFIKPCAKQGKAGVWLVLCLLIVFACGYMHQRMTNCPTPRSRLDLLHALLVHGRLSIDPYHENTPDKAESGGHFYSDKAPGTVILALPAFAAGAALLNWSGAPLDSDRGWLYSSWTACAGSIVIVAAVGAVLLFEWLSARAPSRCALITVLGLFLGAAPLPYATMMFSHSLVVGLLAIAIWAIARQAESQPHSADRGILPWIQANQRSILAGFACGLALASEYTAGIVVLGLFVWLVSGGRQGATPFLAGGAPALLLIPLYSYVCFGNPWILPYSLNASFPEMKEGLYAIKWPNAATAFNLLFSPSRGLFFWTPFFVMAGFGYWQLATRDRKLFWLTYVIPLLQIIVISGRAWDWPAGPTLGPRYLAPIIPLLALPCALGVQRFPRLGVLLASYSVLITTLATLTDACPSFPQHPNPLLDLHIPLFLKGEFSPNLGMVLGLPPYASVALYYAILLGGIWWLWRRLPATEAPKGETAPAATAS